MRKDAFCRRGVIVIAFFLLVPAVLFPQKHIPLEDVPKHIGETVNVCGIVYRASLLDNVKGKPTLMNLGGGSSLERIEIRIKFEDRMNFAYNPEALFLNKHICLTGKITAEHGYPEMIIDKLNSSKLLKEARNLSGDTLGKYLGLVNDSAAKPKNKIIITATNAYLLTGPGLSNGIITWLKVGSSVLIDHYTRGWSYVKVIENTSNPTNNTWLYGFVRNQALGLSKRKRMKE